VRLLELAAMYGDGTLGLPSRFFPSPAEPTVTLTPIGDGPLGTQVVDLRYPSDYEPFLPDARDLHLRASENLTAHARWWTSGRGRRRSSSCMAGAAAITGSPHGRFAVPYWLRHGYDVAAFVLPFHGDRAPGTEPCAECGRGCCFRASTRSAPTRGSARRSSICADWRSPASPRRPGGRRARHEPGRLHDRAVGERGGPDDPAGGIDFAVAMIPAVSMGRLMWRHGEDSPERARAVKAGITEDLLVDTFAVHTPTTRPARLPRERLFVIAGRGDRITPPEHAEALAAHWGVGVRWFDGGHLAQLGRGDAIRDVRRELGKLGFPGRVFRAPER